MSTPSLCCSSHKKMIIIIGCNVEIESHLCINASHSCVIGYSLEGCMKGQQKGHSYPLCSMTFDLMILVLIPQYFYLSLFLLSQQNPILYVNLLISYQQFQKSIPFKLTYSISHLKPPCNVISSASSMKKKAKEMSQGSSTTNRIYTLCSMHIFERSSRLLL